MIVDPTITFGNIIEVAVIAAGGLVALGVMKGTITGIKTEISAVKIDVSTMKTKLDRLADFQTSVALLDQRVGNTEQDIREIRHGRGSFKKIIKGEWPRS